MGMPTLGAEVVEVPTFCIGTPYKMGYLKGRPRAWAATSLLPHYAFTVYLLLIFGIWQNGGITLAGFMDPAAPHDETGAKQGANPIPGKLS